MPFPTCVSWDQFLNKLLVLRALSQAVLSEEAKMTLKIFFPIYMRKNWRLCAVIDYGDTMPITNPRFVKIYQVGWISKRI